MRGQGSPHAVSELASWRLAGSLPVSKALDEVLLLCARLGACLPQGGIPGTLSKPAKSWNSSHVLIAALVRVAAKFATNLLIIKSSLLVELLNCQTTN